MIFNHRLIILFKYSPTPIAYIMYNEYVFIHIHHNIPAYLNKKSGQMRGGLAYQGFLSNFRIIYQREKQFIVVDKPKFADVCIHFVLIKLYYKFLMFLWFRTSKGTHGSLCCPSVKSIYHDINVLI